MLLLHRADEHSLPKQRLPLLSTPMWAVPSEKQVRYWSVGYTCRETPHQCSPLNWWFMALDTHTQLTIPSKRYVDRVSLCYFTCYRLTNLSDLSADAAPPHPSYSHDRHTYVCTCIHTYCIHCTWTRSIKHNAMSHTNLSLYSPWTVLKTKCTYTSDPSSQPVA